MIYQPNQDPKDSTSPEEISAMDKEIQRLREEISAIKTKEKILQANIITLNATMSSHDLQASIAALELEKKEIIARLGPLRAGTVKPVSQEEKDVVEKAWKEWSRKASVRKRICMDLWEYCTEELPEGQTREELWVRTK